MAHDGHRISEAELAQVQARVDVDPRVQAIVRDPRLDGRQKMYQLAALQKDGLLPESYMINVDGSVRFNDGVDWTKWGLTMAGIGSLGVGGVMAGGSAPGLSASASAPAATEAGIYGSAGLSGTAATGSVGSGIVSTTTGGWGRLAPQLIGLGVQGVGSFMQSRAAKNAAAQQMAASERALEFSKGIYNDQKANQQPFIGMGHSAVNTLGGLMGLSQPQASQPQQPTAQPRGALGSMGQMVTMRAPDGSTKQVPVDQVAGFQARGAQVVQ